MENPRSLLPNWTYFSQQKSMDELKQSFLLTMELEDTKLKAQEELKARDQQISQLKQLLTRAIKERDEAQDNCQKLLLHKLLLSTSNSSGLSSINNDDDHLRNSSDCDESIVSSPHNHLAPPPPLIPDQQDNFPLPLPPNAVLPEKGKFLEAVIKAGPLLQTLLLAGPLPQWRHPPPPLDTNQIPPFPAAAATMYGETFPEGISGGCGKVNRKRAAGLSEGGPDDSSKCRRILLH